MKVREVMKHVKTISLGSSVKDAARKMNDHNIGSLIVLDGKKLVGIITERDILGKITALDKTPSKIPVSNIMTSKVIVTRPDDFIDDAVYLMIKNKIKKLPVIEDGEVVGMITSTDIVANSDEIGQYYVFG
ncbi:MAG: CBS domain-containing protein [Nanoarchaeota archaeon]|nr:CBS domain-containing protein [Nanoarchaeota archaeon]